MPDQAASWDIVADRTVQVYEHLLESPTAATVDLNKLKRGRAVHNG